MHVNNSTTASSTSGTTTSSTSTSTSMASLPFVSVSVTQSTPQTSARSSELLSSLNAVPASSQPNSNLSAMEYDFFSAWLDEEESPAESAAILNTPRVVALMPRALADITPSPTSTQTLRYHPYRSTQAQPSSLMQALTQRQAPAAAAGSAAQLSQAQAGSSLVSLIQGNPEQSLLDRLNITRSERDTLLTQVNRDLALPNLDGKAKVKLTMVRLLLLGQSNMQILHRTQTLAKELKVYQGALNDNFIPRAFSYYKTGGLTLLKGLAFSLGANYPADIMNYGLQLYLQDPQISYVRIADALNARARRSSNPEIRALVFEAPMLSTFLKRCEVLRR